MINKSKLHKTGRTKPCAKNKTDVNSEEFKNSKNTNYSDEETKTKRKIIEEKENQILNYTTIFHCIETFLKSLKTFNVCDTSNLRENEKRKILEMVYDKFVELPDNALLNSTMIIFGQPGLGKTLGGSCLNTGCTLTHAFRATQPIR